VFEKIVAPEVVAAGLFAKEPKADPVADQSELGTSAVGAAYRHDTCLA
jgi:hypothetical protein